MEEIHENLYKKVSKISTCIKVYGIPESTNSNECSVSDEIDEIDANAYETFTLEEIRCLIMAYREKDKDFILARVTTPDPENENLFYNFYYAAAEINRVLFRIESSRRLLHRMKVKNPLNNMFIVGQVLYYKITTAEMDSSIVNYYYSAEDNREVMTERAAISQSTLLDEDSATAGTTPIESNRLGAKSLLFTPSDPQQSIQDLKEHPESLPPVPDTKKMTYMAQYFATDDDFLMDGEVRDYFRKNALDPNDEFLYEIDRTQNDFLALLEDVSDDEDDEIGDWRRIFSAHISLALSMLIICLLIGGGPIIAVILLPIALLIMASFIISLSYVLCCRRSTFDTLAVESMSGDVNI